MLDEISAYLILLTDFLSGNIIIKVNTTQLVDDYLGVDITAGAQEKSYTLNQKGLIKILITVGMDASNGKETPAAKEPLGHDVAGAKFDDNWEYHSVL